MKNQLILLIIIIIFVGCSPIVNQQQTNKPDLIIPLGTGFTWVYLSKPASDPVTFPDGDIKIYTIEHDILIRRWNLKNGLIDSTPEIKDTYIAITNSVSDIDFGFVKLDRAIYFGLSNEIIKDNYIFKDYITIPLNPNTGTPDTITYEKNSIGKSVIRDSISWKKIHFYLQYKFYENTWEVKHYKYGILSKILYISEKVGITKIEFFNNDGSINHSLELIDYHF
jgi:hypothetical protein